MNNLNCLDENCKRRGKTAIRFYREIEKDRDKYRLLNGLFIVKEIEKDIFCFFGEFLKGGSVTNVLKRNTIVISPTPQKFNIKKKMVTNARGDIWRKSNIKLVITPIEHILK